MERLYDEFSMSLAAPVPRRESLRRMGAVIAGMVLNPWGLGTVWAGGDPCRAFCRCSNKAQQNQCLAACRACNKETSRLCGTCGDYACCATGERCCSGYCTDLENDFDNCGGCGARCADPAPYEDGACVWGECVYLCEEGALDCDGLCTRVTNDPNNCGACGNVCAGSTPYCNGGTCGAVQCFGGQALCGGVCREIQLDPQNCGGCGVVCGPGENCAGGLCQSAEPPYWGE